MTADLKFAPTMPAKRATVSYPQQNRSLFGILTKRQKRPLALPGGAVGRDPLSSWAATKSDAFGLMSIVGFAPVMMGTSCSETKVLARRQKRIFTW
jgi:hypothetical protein